MKGLNIIVCLSFLLTPSSGVLAQGYYPTTKEKLELEKRQEDLKKGKYLAPNFTLKNNKGKEYSLRNFKGKWVVLDFWASWHPWMQADFYDLKALNDKYTGRIVIVGINGKDTEEDWKETLRQYKLPWVNLHIPEEEEQIFLDYGIYSFPTKVLISPEGGVKFIDTGLNKDIYEIIDEIFFIDDDREEMYLERNRIGRY